MTALALTLPTKHSKSLEYTKTYALVDSLASQTIGASPEVTLYPYQLCRHIHTNDDVIAIAQSFGTQVGLSVVKALI